MKKILLFFAAVCSICSLSAAGIGFTDDDIRQAVFGALDQSETSLRQAPFGRKTIAVLPFLQNGDVLIGRMKNLLTKAGFNCVEGKEDPMWDEILKEIAWDERKSDILDSATIVKFGKLKAAQILLYGRVQVIDKTADRVFVMIELHATEIATKQHIWGGSFAYRFYKGNDVQGIIALDNNLRKLLQKSFTEAGKSLQEPEAAGKLNNIKSVSVIPLAGDIDQYMTRLALEMLSKTNHLPKISQIPSPSQYRSFAREGRIDADAVLFGSVRDLRRTADSAWSEIPGKKLESSYTVYADIQLSLEESKSGIVLWSRTITLSETIKSQRNMTRAELKKYRQEKIDGVNDEIKEDFADNWKSYLKTTGIILGSIILLIILLFSLKAYFSYNHVR